jgi:hypothetical protein
MSHSDGAVRAPDSAASIDLFVKPDSAVDNACPEILNLVCSDEGPMQQRQKDRELMLLGPAVGRRAVNAETNAVIGFGKIFEEVKSRAALPRLKVDLSPAANHDFFHTRMLNRSGLRPFNFQ